MMKLYLKRHFQMWYCCGKRFDDLICVLISFPFFFILCWLLFSSSSNVFVNLGKKKEWCSAAVFILRRTSWNVFQTKKKEEEVSQLLLLLSCFSFSIHLSFSTADWYRIPFHQNFFTSFRAFSYFFLLFFFPVFTPCVIYYARISLTLNNRLETNCLLHWLVFFPRQKQITLPQARGNVWVLKTYCLTSTSTSYTQTNWTIRNTE